MDDAKGKTESPTIGISVNLQYAAGRSVVFQTYVPQDINVEGLNVILEKLNFVGDRAEAYYAQEPAKRQLEIEEKSVANMARRLAEVDDNIRTAAIASNRREHKLSGQELKEKKQAFDTLEEGKRRVAECKAFLDSLIKKAGNRDASTSAADR
jgi:hypothetical protein